MRSLLILAGLSVSLTAALAVGMYLTAFPTPNLRAKAVLKQQEALPQKDQIRDLEVLVGVEWSTAATFRCRMTNDLDHQWTNSLQEWRWFLTWIPRVGPGQTNLDLRSRVLRVREDGMVDQPVDPGTSSTGAHRASRWNPSDVPRPTMSAQVAIEKVEARLRQYPSDKKEVLIVAADWTTPARLKGPRIRGGAYSFYAWGNDHQEKWGWIITCVHRMPPNSQGNLILKDPPIDEARKGRVELYQVDANGQVVQASGGRL